MLCVLTFSGSALRALLLTTGLKCGLAVVSSLCVCVSGSEPRAPALFPPCLSLFSGTTCLILLV